MDAFPTVIDAEFRGLAREAGSFRKQEGGTTVDVDFARAYKFEYEDAEGITREFSLSEKVLDDVAEFDVRGAKKGDRIQIVGVVMVRDGFLKPHDITPRSAAKAA
jgi:hypothetical protein